MKRLLTIICCIFVIQKTIAFDLERIDRYTLMQPVENASQADPMVVIVRTKFPDVIQSVKQAINYLLEQSGYVLSDKYEAYALERFQLPTVHRSIGPIRLKRALEVLVGKGRVVNINHYDRVVKVSLNHIAVEDVKKIRSVNKRVKKQGLDEIVKVHIENEPILIALKKLLPPGWEVVVDDKNIKDKTVNIISDEEPIKNIVNSLVRSAGFESEFYREMKVLVLVLRE